MRGCVNFTLFAAYWTTVIYVCLPGTNLKPRLTNLPTIPTLHPMSNLTRKFIAVIMLLWLPLSSGSALAASIGMQLQQGECHDSAMMMDMSHGDMGEHHMMNHDDMQASSDETATGSSCSICHLACTAFLDAPAIAMQLAETGSQAVGSIPETFVSHLSAPLDPPPLVAA